MLHQVPLTDPLHDHQSPRFLAYGMRTAKIGPVKNTGNELINLLA
ncbi:hypothetical protein ACVWZV_009720 [Bradyrhizobium sp. GM5.1]